MRLLRGCSIRALRLAVALGLVAASLTTADAAEKPVTDPMEFVLVHGGGQSCSDDGRCSDWISAEGQITADSPAKLTKLLKKIGKKTLPVIVRSPGGDVAAAMQMGLVIRKKGLSVAVGGTRSIDCPPTDPMCKAARQRDGSVRGEIYSTGAVCFSACPLLLAGGVRRVAGPFALIGVHQITTTYREERVRYRTEYEMVHGRKKVISQQEIGRKFVGQHDTTKLGKKQKAALIAYLKKLGVDAGIFDLMMSATPSSIHVIMPQESLQLGMTTENASAEDLVLAAGCANGKLIATCLAATAPLPPPPARGTVPPPPAPPAAAAPIVQPPASGDDAVVL